MEAAFFSPASLFHGDDSNDGQDEMQVDAEGEKQALEYVERVHKFPGMQLTVGTSNSRSPKKDAGLMWQSGVRRSTRIRSRPLQHWLGERFVYGRIHGTMATVIGVKSYSPTQDGKAAMRVKSFVTEQYSDIVVASVKY